MYHTTTRITVELNEQTVRTLRSQAQASAYSLDELVQMAIAAYLRDVSTLLEVGSPTQERHARIRQEAAAWRAMPEAERRRYADGFVAVHGGKVVDSDQDRLTLLERMRRQYGGEPILITPASAAALREFSRIGLRRGE